MAPPVPPRVGGKVRDILLSLLSDEAGGFNATVAAWADAYSVDPFEIDFGDRSANFFLGDVDADDIEGGQPVLSIPMALALSVGRRKVRNYEKFMLFSGDVTAKIVAKLAWQQDHAKHDFEGYGELFADVVTSIFNREQNQDVWNPYVAYNGDIEVAPSRIGRGEEHWRQDIVATLGFEVRVVQ